MDRDGICIDLWHMASSWTSLVSYAPVIANHGVSRETRKGAPTLDLVAVAQMTRTGAKPGIVGLTADSEWPHQNI